jgi:MFS family permease
MADPFSRDPALPDLAERANRTRAGAGYSWVLVPALVIVTAVLLASPLFGVSQGLAALVIGAELVLAALTAFIGVARKRAIAGIAATTGREGYQRILRASAHYRWVGSVYGLAISTGTIVAAAIFFRDAVEGSLGGTAAASLPALGEVTPGDLLLLLVAFRLLQTVTSRLRYRWIRSLPETKDYAELNRRFLVINRKDRLVRYVPVAGVATLGLFLLHGVQGIPLEIPLAAAGFTLLLLVLSLLLGMREKAPRKKASPDKETPPAFPSRNTPDPQGGESLQKSSLPAPGGAAHDQGAGTLAPGRSISEAFINRDPVFPDGGDYDPWW